MEPKIRLRPLKGLLVLNHGQCSRLAYIEVFCAYCKYKLCTVVIVPEVAGALFREDDLFLFFSRNPQILVRCHFKNRILSFAVAKAL